MAKITKQELKRKTRGELVRMAEGARLDHTGSNEQLVSRLVEALETEPALAEPREE